MRVGGSIGGLAAAAAFATFLVQPSGDPLDPLIDATLTYQARRLPADIAFEGRGEVEAFLTEQIGRTVALPKLPTLPVRGARYMPAHGKHGAMIVLGGGADRVDLFAVEADKPTGKRLGRPRVVDRAGREVLQWYRDGMIYSATAASGRAPNALFQFAGYRP